MNKIILMVEDDKEYLNLVSLWLSNSGYEVITAEDGVEGIRLVYSKRPDLVLLDANLPRLDGWEVCRRIREMSETPVIMLTVNEKKTDILQAFSFGADDYICKPVDFDELLARVKAVLHRTNSVNSENRAGTYCKGDLEIDWASRQIWVRKQRIKLSPTEFKVLSCLVKNQGWIVTHEQILEKAWGPNYIGDKSFVKLYVRYLRQKIEKNPSKPEMIITERGTGYSFVSQNDLPSLTGGAING